jgi:hypothetical protein
VSALANNTVGSYNTASGVQSLANSKGDYNTVSGYAAMINNNSGQQNTATGVFVLHNNRTGNYNVAAGVDALFDNTSGSYNIGVGYKAGYNVITGGNNIEVGNQGTSSDTSLIRIGTQGTQTATYIAGISGITLTGTSTLVSVNANGQLGLAGSSERFKATIAPIGAESERLDDLHPVTFHYKSEPNGPKHYGLIAEDVAKVFPELVVRSAKGEILSVRYDELAPMLLNEMKRQQQQLNAQAAEIRELKAAVFAQRAQN